MPLCWKQNKPTIRNSASWSLMVFVLISGKKLLTPNLVFLFICTSLLQWVFHAQKGIRFFLWLIYTRPYKKKGLGWGCILLLAFFWFILKHTLQLSHTHVGMCAHPPAIPPAHAWTLAWIWPCPVSNKSKSQGWCLLSHYCLSRVYFMVDGEIWIKEHRKLRGKLLGVGCAGDDIGTWSCQLSKHLDDLALYLARRLNL